MEEIQDNFLPSLGVVHRQSSPQEQGGLIVQEVIKDLWAKL